MRKLTGIGSMIVLAVVLVACGGDGGDEEAEATVAPTETVATTDAPSTDAPAQDASPASPITSGTPGATPAGIASPTISTPAAPGASLAGATPGLASPAAPFGQAGAASAETQLLTGTVTLPGTANERFVIADDGCVGLGEYAGLQAGQQVIVRDGSGVIIGVANLAPTNSGVVCSWTFELEVPVSDFYAVSIPMRAEQVYTQDEVAASDGRIELTLP